MEAGVHRNMCIYIYIHTHMCLCRRFRCLAAIAPNTTGIYDPSRTTQGTSGSSNGSRNAVTTGL